MVADDSPGHVSLDPSTQQSFDLRWEHYLPDLWIGLSRVYGDRADETLQRIRAILLKRCAERPDDLKRLDEARLLEPDWLQQPTMIGYATYTDHFSGTLKGISDHLDHLCDMGVRYLHLMPLLQPRQGTDDGGYAVADHRTIRTDLGTMDDLADLTATLRAHDISLVMDLIVNHVAAEHEWARRARAGQQKYRDYFHILSTQDEVDAWEKNLPDVFPDFAHGNFSWDDDCQGWVWATFNEFQWDLNWANADVFCEFLDLMCVLANRGVRGVPPRRHLLHLEETRHQLSEPSGSSRHHSVIASGDTDRRARRRFHGRCHRRPRRSHGIFRTRAPLGKSLRHDLSQQPHGAAVERPGYPQRQPHGNSVESDARQTLDDNLGHLRSMPRRHWVDRR